MCALSLTGLHGVGTRVADGLGLIRAVRSMQKVLHGVGTRVAGQRIDANEH
jgi:hypothetical protein